MTSRVIVHIGVQGMKIEGSATDFRPSQCLETGVEFFHYCEVRSKILTRNLIRHFREIF